MNVHLRQMHQSQRKTSGTCAILSGDANPTNQNIWIGEMKKSLKQISKPKLVDTVFTVMI